MKLNHDKKCTKHLICIEIKKLNFDNQISLLLVTKRKLYFNYI